ncbi:hypothetical protein OH782_39725 [Streptomyces sp. NBC_01544]|uniref:hypothetical protein n=1 Tax=unclassified Streptomyces TaxID=2593676 RepID=UPI00386C9CD4|nr:hypothetical protein OG987_01960 [Streptomyces sp. NBC_01620]
MLSQAAVSAWWHRGADLAVVAYARCGEGLVEVVHLPAAELRLRGDPVGEQVRTPGSVGADGAQGKAAAPHRFMAPICRQRGHPK